MREIHKIIEDFDIGQICNSGQCFRMDPVAGEEKNVYRVLAGDRCLKLSQQGNEVIFYCEQSEYDEFWEKYFDLAGDYHGWKSQINPNDKYLVTAAEFGGGVRILHQDLWEMIVSFLISQQNNIVRIRRCIQNICEKYGKPMVDHNGEVYYSFPQPEALAVLEENALMKCNLGYRSKYVVRTARSVVSGEVDLDYIRGLSYAKAKQELLKLYGVGAKVADCICLFALHHLDAFPIDTHINQVLETQYKRGFPNRRYKGFRGVMQQYIFYYELFGKKNSPDTHKARDHRE